MRVAVTGATGCIGTYVARALLAGETTEVRVLVRQPNRLSPAVAAHPRVHVIVGDVRDEGLHSALVARADALVLAATSWGGDDAHAVNVVATEALVDQAASVSCPHVIYLSTASVLAADASPLREAAELGTPYVRTKAATTRSLLARRDVPLTVLYPTLVLGGEDGAPSSHLARLLGAVAARAWLLRFVTLTGSFHLTHARDVARIIAWLVERPALPGAPREMVVGGPPVTAEALIDEILRSSGRRRMTRMAIDGAIIGAMIRLFRIQLTPWDRYCLERRHFTYRDTVSPSTLGLTEEGDSLTALIAAALCR